MASLYHRPRSPFFWIKFRGEDGSLRRKSTGILLNQRRAAKALCAEITARETAGAQRRIVGGEWEKWVLTFIESKPHPPTRLGYLYSWKRLSEFFVNRGVLRPADVTATHVREYLVWATQTRTRRCQYTTARVDVGVLSMLMNHAQCAGMIRSNPTSKLRLAAGTPKIKHEISSDHLKIITTALTHAPAWAQVAFQIALHTGCRLHETVIPRDCVNFAEGTITFPCPKGGTTKAFTRPLPPELALVLRDALRNPAATHTCAHPAKPSDWWSGFFRRLGLPYTFHCLRVTYISNGIRAGVPEPVLMRLVNHATPTVHRLYQRMNLADLRHWADRIQPPHASALESQ